MSGNVTWIKGAHNIRAGVEVNLQRDEEFQIQATFCGYCEGAGGFQFEQGTTQFNGGPAGNDYNAFASFLLGLPMNAGKVTCSRRNISSTRTSTLFIFATNGRSIAS